MSRTAGPPLYATEQEIAAAVLGPGHFPEWKALAIVLEREGLPRIDPITSRRYFPAVKQWFDRRHRVDTIPGATQDEFTWTPRRPGLSGGNAPAGAGSRTGSRARTL